jgi:signal peptidase I
MTASGDPPPIAPPNRRSALRAIGIPIALVLATLASAFLLARAFYVDAFKVSPPDMAPNLVAGDHIVVRKDAYRPREHRVPARGDIIVFGHPEHPEHQLVERVIGLPGDTITVEQGAVFINGWRIPTCVAGIVEIDVGDKVRPGFAVLELLGDTAYVVFHDPPAREHGEESEQQHHRPESEGPYTVPLNEVFVLGDNREHSQDSRHWLEGRGRGVRVDDIKGRASSIGMAFGKGGKINWSRVGASLIGGPKCPEGFPAAPCSALERCLANRPPPESTRPPADGSTGAVKR